MNSVHPAPFTLFLDIDGVLNNYGMTEAERRNLHTKAREGNQNLPFTDRILRLSADFFNSQAVAQLNKLIDAIKIHRPVQIILTSNWKRGYSIHYFTEHIFEHLAFSPYLVDKTPDLSHHSSLHCPLPDHPDQACRAEEILDWLNRHEEVEDFAILDDIDDHLSEHFSQNFYRTDLETLLTADICAAIAKQSRASAETDLDSCSDTVVIEPRTP